MKYSPAGCRAKVQRPNSLNLIKDRGLKRRSPHLTLQPPIDEPSQRGEPFHDKMNVYAGERNIFCFKDSRLMLMLFY